MERENGSLMQAQGKHEDDALTAAVGYFAVESFQHEFKTNLKAVKAGGGPYQVRGRNILTARDAPDDIYIDCA